MESFLLKYLCCPETGQSLRLVNKIKLEELNKRICLRSVFNRSGQIINDPLEAALMREDGRFAYPIHSDIPVLLLEEAIATLPGTLVESTAHAS